MIARIRPAALLAALLLVVSACGDDDSDGGATATLRVLAGAVEIQQDGDAAVLPAVDGQSLGVGALVRTGVDGRAAIEWPDGSITRLDFDTEFRITQLRTAGPLAGGRVEGEQETGATYHRVIELTGTGDRFAVATPSATAAVQGTTYTVIVAADGSSTVLVLDGIVVVTTPGGDEVVVEAGSMVTVDADGGVTGPQPIPEELLAGEWIQFNEGCDLGECPLVVGPSAVTAIEIAPADATIDVGESQGYITIGRDDTGAEVGQVAAEYAIDGTPCDGSFCTPPEPGDYIVTATFAGLSATADLTVLATGDIQVTLDWTALVDLDLWVTDPAGETVMWDHPFSASGGRLDRDAYPDCVFSEVPPENTVWDETAPSGEYLVTVHVYDMCGAAEVSFVLTVSVGGEVVLEVEEVLTATDETYEVAFEKS